MRSASTGACYRSLRKRARVPGFVLALAVGLVLPGQAAGAVTIGSSLDAVPDIVVVGQFTLSQRNLITSHQAAGGLTSPINGVVVRWRVRAGSESPPIAFRVIRPGADADEAATGAGTSAPKDPLQNTTTSFGLNPGMPIQVGDGIGLDTPESAQAGYLNNEGSVGAINVWTPPLPDGGAPQSPSFITGTLELLLQAVIEPDKDNDGLGDESQDPDGGNPPPPKPPAKPACLIDAPVLGGNIRVFNSPCIARL